MPHQACFPPAVGGPTAGAFPAGVFAADVRENEAEEDMAHEDPDAQGRGAERGLGDFEHGFVEAGIPLRGLGSGV